MSDWFLPVCWQGLPEDPHRFGPWSSTDRFAQNVVYVGQVDVGLQICAHGLVRAGRQFQESSLWAYQRSVKLRVMEDNQATILVVKKGYSPKLRHISRTHKVNLSCLSEVFTDEGVTIEYVDTKEQAADIFTKAFDQLSKDILYYYVCWCKGEACDVSTLKDDDAAGCCELCVCV